LQETSVQPRLSLSFELLHAVYNTTKVGWVVFNSTFSTNGLYQSATGE